MVSGTGALFAAGGSDETTLRLPAPATASTVQSALASSGIMADIVPGEDGVAVELADPLDIEVARTALDGLAQPEVPVTEADTNAEYGQILADLGRGVWLALGLALVQAATATAIGASASVLEQGQTLAALRLAGMTRASMMKARLLHAAIPVGVIAALSTGLGAGAAGVILVASGPAGLRPDIGGLLGLPAVVVGAILAAVLGAATAWPVLRNVTANPLVDA